MLAQKLPLDMMQTQWAQELNPIIKNQLLQGLLIPNITITNGINVINHLLGRKQIGYIVTDINAPATMYRSQPLNDKTLTLTSNSDAIISIWCF